MSAAMPPVQSPSPSSSSSSSSSSTANNNNNNNNNNNSSNTQTTTPPAPTLPSLNVSISVGTNNNTTLPPPSTSSSPPPSPSSQQIPPPPNPLNSSPPPPPPPPLPQPPTPPAGPPPPSDDGSVKGNTSTPPPSPSPSPSLLPSSPPPPTPTPTPIPTPTPTPTPSPSPPPPPPTPTSPPPISNQSPPLLQPPPPISSSSPPPPPPISSPPLQPPTDGGRDNKISPPPPPPPPTLSPLPPPSSPPPFLPPPPTLQFSPPLPFSPPFSPPPPALASGPTPVFPPPPDLASGPTPVFPPPLPINMIPPSSPPSTTLAPNSSPPSDSKQFPLASPSTNSDVPSSSSSTPSSRDSSPSNNTVVVGAIAGGTVALAIVALIAVVVFVVLRKKRKTTNDLSSQYKSNSRTLSSKPADNMYYASKPPASSSGLGNTYGSHRVPGYHSVMPESGGSKLWFSNEELKDYTNGFSQENLLGEGGFGCVYKGCLPDGTSVAVKQLKVGGSQGEREFRAEVEIISRVHHRHLVSLVGYCVDEHHRLLVYDYLPNKTLEYHLHGNGLPVLEWSKRVKIAIGSARGLAYLHEDCHPRIIHRDIKSSNILLDNCFEAQVSDFGLAKLSNDSHSHVSTRVMGTFGYMAPEYASSGKLTDRSDVFSFGVVLLEIITGRKPVDPSQPLGDESLVEWARPLLVCALETGDYEELVDPRLDNNFVRSEMMLMIEAAAACVRHSASKRPRMVQVVRALDNECDLSNGMKFGQSTIYNSAQYSAEIRRFHRSGTDSEEFSSNYDSSREHEQHSRRSSTFSGEFSNREVSP